MDDPFNLTRFVEAQNPIYDRVCSELRRGRKTSHWMWFIFPQIEGLGFSGTSRRYAISGLEEARAYLEHPLLGARLEECTGLVCAVRDRTIQDILGSPDDLKFCSCMTLFCQVSSEPNIFEAALNRYFSGHPDPLTLGRIREAD